MSAQHLLLLIIGLHVSTDHSVNTTHMYGFSFNVSTIDFNPLR